MAVSILGVVIGLCLIVPGIYGGECCKAHYGILVEDNDEMWCSNYCCRSLTSFYCCDNVLLQADSDDIESVCADYFKSNVWAPILIALGCAAIIACCCVCFYCCCCRRNVNPAPIMLSSTAANPGVTVVNSSNQITNMAAAPPPNPYHAGYDQRSY